MRRTVILDDVMEEDGDRAPIELGGEPFSGLITSLDLETGRVIVVSEVHRGYDNGLEVTFDISGAVREVVESVQGQAIGLHASWDDQGRLAFARRLHFGYPTQQLTEDSHGVLSVLETVEPDEDGIAGARKHGWGRSPPPARVSTDIPQLLSDADLRAHALIAEATRAVTVMGAERVDAYRRARIQERTDLLGESPND